MIILKLISPKNIPNKRTNWNACLRFYYWALVKLMPIYKRGAIADTINMGEMQIVHNVRDYWYEQELQRFHVDTAMHIEKQSNLNIKQKYHRAHIFNWTESLCVFNNGKSYMLSRRRNITLETDIEGVLKISNVRDFILRTEFTTKLVKATKSGSKESETPRATKINTVLPIKPTEPNKIKYQGFEEDCQF